MSTGLAGVRERARSDECRDLRKQRGRLNAELRLQQLDVQHRDAQVAIVPQRDLDQLLQARVGEEVAPADVAGRRRAPAVRSSRRTQGQLDTRRRPAPRPHVLGLQRAPGHQHGEQRSDRRD